VLRRLARIGLWLGILGGIAYALSRSLAARPDPQVAADVRDEPWPPLPEAATGWVEPLDASCPVTHPVKAKLGSKIFHLPGMANYERTRPDRCYASAADAEADGLRPAKR
jgi:hypothetical protein